MSQIVKNNGDVSQYKLGIFDELILGSTLQTSVSAVQGTDTIVSAPANSGFAVGGPVLTSVVSMNPVLQMGFYTMTATLPVLAGTYDVVIQFVGGANFACINGTSNTDGVQVVSVTQLSVNSLSIKYTTIGGVTPIISVSTVNY